MRVALINMPFAEVRYPSIALTQLKAVVSPRLGDRVDLRVHYLNHDFARYFGPRAWATIISLPGTVAGLGDWLFRHLAFPDQADNADAYFRRHAPRLALDRVAIDDLLSQRTGIAALLEELIDRDALHECGLAGFTTMFSQNVPSFAMARRLKKRNPEIVTVLGGANSETSMGRVIARRVDAIDFAFSGPALVNFPEFVECLVEGRADDCHRLKGVLSKRKVALQVRGRGDEVGEELGLDVEVPLDYRDFLQSFAELPKNGAQPVLFFETSRGCWWGERSHCTFCGLNGTGMKYRAMSPDKAIAQFERMFEYAPGVTQFDSVDNILPREYLTEVMPQLRPPPDVELFYEVKADLKEHEMKVLADAGVRRLQPGIEALSTTTLKLMRKGTTAAQNLLFLKHCVKYGTRPIWGLLIGFPGEEQHIYEKYLRDIPRFTHLPPPSGVYPVRFDRYSPYYTGAQEYGLELKPYDFYGMVYPFGEQELADLAYFFVDHTYDAPYARLSAEWIAPLREAVDRWQSLWDASGDQSRPKLELVQSNGSAVVRDTRGGAEVTHEVSPVAVRVLDVLKTARRLPRVLTDLSDVSEAAISAELSRLVERGLLFEEDGMFMSLLLDGEAG